MIKNIKRFGAIALTVTMLLGSTSMAFATETPATPNDEKNTTIEAQVIAGNYIVFNGEIKAVAQNGGGMGTEMIVTSENPQNGFEEMRFTISEETVIMQKNKKGLVAGDKVSVVYNSNQPMTMSLPPLTSAKVVFTEVESFAKTSVFDKEFLSADKDLKLNISDETVIVDLENNKVKKEDIIGKDVVVFYSITTRSIPAQTNPEKIVVLPEVKEVEATEIKDEAKEVKMIPIREEAEKLGFKVEWVQEQQAVVIAKEGTAMTITLRVGDKSYGYNKALGMFETAPEVRDGKTFVESSILDLLK